MSKDRNRVPPDARPRATMREVARSAAVSLGTVSRVINNKQSVRAEVRARVQAAMANLGYVPDAVAQSMRTQATRSVGCMVSDVSNQLFSRAVSAAEGVLHRSAYTMILTNSQDSKEREIEILSLFRRRRVDGVICSVSREDDPEIVGLLGGLGLPVVLLERTMDLGVDAVATDHRSGAYQAASYLLTLGHRRIGLITVSQDALPGRERARGFEKAHGERKVPVDPALMAFHGFSADYGYRTAYEFLTSRHPPTALIAGANQMVGALKAVRALKLSIPRDLSLISFGDTDVTELFSPPLTCVRWDPAATGQMAAEVLLSRLDGTARKGPLRMALPAELVLRQSCAPSPG